MANGEGGNMDIYQKGAAIGKGSAEVTNLIRVFGKQRAEAILDDLTKKKTARTKAAAINPHVSQRDLHALASVGVSEKQVNATYSVYGREIADQITADLTSGDGARRKRGKQLAERGEKVFMWRDVTPNEISQMGITLGISDDLIAMLSKEFTYEAIARFIVKYAATKALSVDPFYGV